MTQLSVNINKIATIRNARGGNTPNLCQVAIDCQGFGCQGITVHPRPDQRHIKYQDVYDLKNVVSTEFNIEGYPSPDFLKLVCEVRPEQVTLVPDPPEAITSNAGWDTIKHQSMLKELVSELKSHGIRTSLFTDTHLAHIEHAKKTGADRVELYTEPYAEHYSKDKQQAVTPFIEAAQLARSIGLGVNAGHDLSLENIAWLSQNIPFLAEVSIGHALISEALYLGLQETIQRYLKLLKRA